MVWARQCCLIKANFLVLLFTHSQLSKCNIHNRVEIKGPKLEVFFKVYVTDFDFLQFSVKSSQISQFLQSDQKRLLRPKKARVAKAGFLLLLGRGTCQLRMLLEQYLGFRLCFKKHSQEAMCSLNCLKTAARG